MKALIKIIAVAGTLMVPAVLADTAFAADDRAGFHRNLGGTVSGTNHQRLDVRHRVNRHFGHRFRGQRFRGHGFRRGCHRVRRSRFTRHGRRVFFGGIMCYDYWGRPYIVAGSRHFIR